MGKIGKKGFVMIYPPQNSCGGIIVVNSIWNFVATKEKVQVLDKNE